MDGVLGAVFREYGSRVWAGHAGENQALIQRVAVSSARSAPGKGSTPIKRLKAGWNDDYLLQVLQETESRSAVTLPADARNAA
jgi:hypothetical protein